MQLGVHSNSRCRSPSATSDSVDRAGRRARGTEAAPRGLSGGCPASRAEARDQPAGGKGYCSGEAPACCVTGRRFTPAATYNYSREAYSLFLIGYRLPSAVLASAESITDISFPVPDLYLFLVSVPARPAPGIPRRAFTLHRHPGAGASPIPYGRVGGKGKKEEREKEGKEKKRTGKAVPCFTPDCIISR